jgi:hypothetical protein
MFFTFSSHFDRLLLQLQTLQVSEGVLVQKIFFKSTLKSKEIDVIMGGKVV